MKLKTYIIFAVLLCIATLSVALTASYKAPLPNERGVAVFEEGDSLRLTADSLRGDSLPLTAYRLPEDSLKLMADSLQLMADSIAKMDSLSLAELDSLIDVYESKNVRKAVQWNDSIAAVQDSINASKKESPLDAPVVYTATDSVVFVMGSKNAYLYGDAQVNYTNIELKSEEIQMNMDSSIVHAIGATDSLGKLYGTPIFKEGDDTYESETMSYNFKSKRVSSPMYIRSRRKDT